MQLREIDKRIGQLKSMVADVNTFVQATAEGIVEHFAAHGDCTRAGKLVQALPNSFRREYLIRWFENAGITINPSEGYATKAISRDSKRYRPPNEALEFATHNRWFEAVDADGNRAPWYQGPTPRTQEPNTMLDFGDGLISFADRTHKAIREGKIRGTDVPLYQLSDQEKADADKALAILRKLGLGFKANGVRANLEAELTKLDQAAGELNQTLANAPDYEQVADDDATIDVPAKAVG
jgi:hypothetical protein